jgi:hypothetical protein
MQTVVKKLAAAGFLLFVGPWAAGIVRSYTLERPEPLTLAIPVVSAIDDYRSRLHVANNLKQIGLAEAPLLQILQQAGADRIQVYEKTAQLTSGTSSFSADEAWMRQVVATHKAVIFSERANGLTPDRVLALGIRVGPEHFDVLLDELTRVGQLASISVVQQDRTGDFRHLQAQRQSLQKHQEALLKLRGASKLSVEEALKLEQRLLEVEKEIQSVGVQLGDLLSKEPSYNLFITLQEYQPGGRHDPGFTFGKRLGNALVWALGWWVVAALGIGLLVGTYVSIKTLRPVTVTADHPGPAAPAPPAHG